MTPYYLAHLVRDEPEVEKRSHVKTRRWWFLAGILVGIWTFAILSAIARMALA